MIDAVVFDWGGTLSHFAEVEMLDMWRLAARHLAPDREDELTARLVAVEAEHWATTATTQRSATLASSSAARRRRSASTWPRRSSRRPPDATSTRGPRTSTTAPTRRRRSRRCAARGLRTGLLSNTHWPRDFHEQFLARDGLADLIDARLYTSHMEFQKPHASAFRAALDALGVTDPGRAVFVGDRPWDDITGARDVGMRTVLIVNTWAEPADVVPDATITELGELVGVIDEWAAEPVP